MNAPDQTTTKPISRREFVRKSAFTVSLAPALGAGCVSLITRPARAAGVSPNEKIRLGLIGAGGMGGGDLECFFRFPEVECAVICDVDDAHIAKGLEVCAKQERRKPDTVKDFRRVLDRKDVDVVLVATPDHWHALPTVMACQAGKVRGSITSHATCHSSRFTRFDEECQHRTHEQQHRGSDE